MKKSPNVYEKVPQWVQQKYPNVYEKLPENCQGSFHLKIERFWQALKSRRNGDKSPNLVTLVMPAVGSPATEKGC